MSSLVKGQYVNEEGRERGVNAARPSFVTEMVCVPGCRWRRE